MGAVGALAGETAEEEEGEGGGVDDDSVGDRGDAEGAAVEGEGGDDGADANEEDELGEEEEGEVGEEGGLTEVPLGRSLERREASSARRPWEGQGSMRASV